MFFFHKIKIRGVRVEIEEIERVLSYALQAKVDLEFGKNSKRVRQGCCSGNEDFIDDGGEEIRKCFVECETVDEEKRENKFNVPNKKNIDKVYSKNINVRERSSSCNF